MQVSFRLGESDISQVTVGQEVRVTVASANATFDSKVKSIDYASYTGNSVAYYTAVVNVDTSSTADNYPGMQATVTIPKEEVKDVVVLKMDAVSTAMDNSAFVYLQQADGTMKEQTIIVGVSNGNYVEVKEGLGDGSHEVGYESLLFDSGKIHTIDITMKDWSELIANATAEEYRECEMTIDGENLGNVRTQKRSAVSTGRFFWFCSNECVSTVASAPASSR